MNPFAGVLPGLPYGLEWRLLLIPLITGIIGYGTNWVAIRLLFRPLEFVGVRVPGMKELAPSFPRKLKQIPGVVEGRLGWQGNDGASSVMPGTRTPTNSSGRNSSRTATQLVP